MALVRLLLIALSVCLTYPACAQDWSTSGNGFAQTRFTALTEITAANVKHLHPVWSFSTGVLRGHEGEPLVIGHMMYLVTPFPNVVYALDLAQEGAVLWKYTPRQDAQTPAIMCCDTVHKGLAYEDGRIFVQLADTTVVALDANTGKELWSVKNGETAKGETNTSAALAVHGKLIVGLSGGEFGARCHVTAYDQATGQRLWRAYATGPDQDLLIDPEKTTQLGHPIAPNSSLKSWQGTQWQQGGACAWGWFTYDPELNLIYYGTGNPSTWNPAQRPGDNAWAMTIFARDLTTGQAKWLYQMTPHDEWDYDGVNEMILTTQEIQGQPRKVLSHFDRNGFAYLLDRATGELLSAQKFDPAVNWATGIDLDPQSKSYGRPKVDPKYSTDQNGEDNETEGICPGALGAKNEAPAAYSAQTGLFYVPTNHICMTYEPFRVTYKAGQPYVGATLTLVPGPSLGGKMGTLTAWDPVKSAIAWKKDEVFSVWSGPLATAGGVVFYGSLDGYLKAIDAKTGADLWRFKTPSGIVGNVMSYQFQGHQYVAVMSGIGGWAGIGLAAGLTDPHDGSGAVGAYQGLSHYVALGGVLTVFGLE